MENYETLAIHPVFNIIDYPELLSKISFSVPKYKYIRKVITNLLSKSTASTTVISILHTNKNMFNANNDFLLILFLS